MTTMRHDDSHTHTTAHEIAFIRGLGGWTDREPYASRRQMLIDYRRIMKQRPLETWGAVSPHKVLAAVVAELALIRLLDKC